MREEFEAIATKNVVPGNEANPADGRKGPSLLGKVGKTVRLSQSLLANDGREKKHVLEHRE